jgi:hypothetical protein
MAQAQIDTPQVAFEKLVVAMMTRLDDMMEKYGFQDGDYKEFAEDLLRVRNLQNQLRPNTIYVEIARRALRAPRKPRNPPPSLEVKMTSDKYEWCELCNTPIKIHKKGYFKNLHLQTAKCSQIAQTKKTTIKTPIFKNVGFDIPLQVINRCVWKKMRGDKGKLVGQEYWFSNDWRSEHFEWVKDESTKKWFICVNGIIADITY